MVNMVLEGTFPIDKLSPPKEFGPPVILHNIPRLKKEINGGNLRHLRVL